jgi:hypothetical protein
MITSKTQVDVAGTPTLLYVPQINMNGTSKESLMAELYEAHDALFKAIKAVGDITVHGRDWQTVEDEAEFLAARTMQARRVATLDQIKDELGALYALIEQQ